MTYREWNLMKPATYSHIPGRRAIPACRKPDLIEIFKLTFQGQKNDVKSLWLDKAIPGILKAHQMVLCSYRRKLSGCKE
jgi:hypothetical protein